MACVKTEGYFDMDLCMCPLMVLLNLSAHTCSVIHLDVKTHSCCFVFTAKSRKKNFWFPKEPFGFLRI